MLKEGAFGTSRMHPNAARAGKRGGFRVPGAENSFFMTRITKIFIHIYEIRLQSIASISYFRICISRITLSKINL